jgi:hypothetical protein
MSTTAAQQEGVLDEATVTMLRQKTGAERWHISCNLFSSMRRTLASRLRSDHPGWSDEQINHEIARRFAIANDIELPG